MRNLWDVNGGVERLFCGSFVEGMEGFLYGGKWRKKWFERFLYAYN